MNIKKDLIDLISLVIDEGKYSNVELNKLFNNNVYSKSEKSFINSMLNTVLKNYIYIDYVIDKLSKSPRKYIKNILRVSIAQIIYTDKDCNGIVYEAVEIAKDVNEFQAKFVNSFLRKFITEKDKLYEEAKLATKLSYPQWFVDKIKIQFGEDKYIDVLKRYKEKSYFSVRVNHNNVNYDRFKELLKNIDTEILFEVNDVYYLSNNNILKTLEYINGDIYIQDGSSNLVVYALNPSSSDEVYDVAAAPGGKSLAILDKYRPKRLVATDIYEHKVKELKKYTEKYKNFEVYQADARNFDEGMYDKILLDLPCSGLGVLTKKPEKIYNISPKDIKEIKRLQKKIFDNVYKLLKKGGEMVYSTCTILDNENTNNIEYFLDKYEDLKVINVEYPDNVVVIKDKFGGSLISYENKYLDGFYIIKFKKR